MVEVVLSFYLKKKNQKETLLGKLASERTRYTRSNPDPNPPPVFDNPNLIPRILRREGSQESSGRSRPLSRSAPCPVKWIYFDEIPFDERFETSLFVNFSETELSRLVLDPLFFEYLQLRFVSLHIDRHLQNYIQSE